MTTVRKLHVGGKERADGWEIINAVPAPEVDHVGDARDLSRFPAATFQQIYASHVLEHLDYKNEVAQALREWQRVLVPGGRLMISVPDIEILARLIVDRGAYDLEQRFLVMRMMFGGHYDAFDYHLVGFNDEMLAWFLGATGFVNMRRVERLGLFNDTSELQFQGRPISINMIAEKPQPAWSSFGWTPVQPDLGDLTCICGENLLFTECHGQLRPPAG